MKKFIEKLFEGMFRISGFATSIVILLIVLFLFKEGSGLFNTQAVEKGYVLAVNAQNPVTRLSPTEIKQVFDYEITDWSALGGIQGEIRPFRFNEMFQLYSESEMGKDYELLPQKLGEVIAADPHIVAFVPKRYLPENDGSISILKEETIALADFFSGQEWLPTATPAPLFGVLPLVLGTLLVSIVAILIALPLGLGVAIYMSELAGERVRRILKPTIELLAGIPSVVYGFFGLAVMVPFLQQSLNLPVGETALAGSLILAIMALPTIITVAEDAMRGTPRMMREASLAMGATQWQTIWRIVIPYASSGISAAVVLGIGRAIGETMAVLMVTGNAAVMPTSLTESVRTIPATIAAELGEAPAGGAHYQALFMLGCILFVMTMIISISAEIIGKKKHTF